MENTYRILGQDIYMDNNTWHTGLNNNDLIVGPSGAGKTRGYVKPNIMQGNESMIIADTKGNLVNELGPMLWRNGYQVIHMNFKDMSQTYGYNPMDYIRFNPKTGKYVTQDIMTIAEVLSPSAVQSDPFWDQAARMYLTSLIAYTMEALPREEHNLKIVAELFAEIHSGNYAQLIEELKRQHPDSYAARCFSLFQNAHKSSKTEASITTILGEKFNGLLLDEAISMYTAPKRIRFSELAQRKTAVFLSISDLDRSMDRLVSLFYTQALQTLCQYADTQCANSRLPIPVRFILDDFATNAFIPDFQNIISVIRSREIYVSIILQSITQLTALYGQANATTIVNNCDNLLYLGGQDVDTAQFISPKMNLPVSTILNMKLNEAYLFTRGSSARSIQKYDIRVHPRYSMLGEAKQEMADVPEWGM